MSGIHILGTGRAVPEKTLSNDDLSRTLDTSDEWIFSRTGIKTRHIADHEESAESLAIKAAREAIAEARKSDPGFSEEKIDLIITATMTADHVFPSVSCIVQQKLGLPEEIAAFDLNAACTGFVYALQSAYCMLDRMEKTYALVIGAERMSSVLDYTDRSSCVLFGDGAGAALISIDRSSDALFVPVYGTRGDDQTLYCQKSPKGDGFLHMKGPTVYSFATTVLKEAVNSLLIKSGQSMDDIDMVICHQANARIIDSVKRRYPGNEGKFFKNICEYANTSAASTAIALDDAIRQGLIRKGMTVIMAAFGAGLSWNGILMTV